MNAVVEDSQATGSKRHGKQSRTTIATALRDSHCPRSGGPHAAELRVNENYLLNVNGTEQRVRICASRAELPPLLIVQAGPGLPTLSEVPRFQRLLRLEENFAVCYWEQRGCGDASRRDAAAVSFATQVEDVCAVIDWLAEKSGHQVALLGISLGATAALLALENVALHCKSMVAVSIDTDTSASDDFAFHAIRSAGAASGSRKFSKWSRKLAAYPYTTAQLFQLRARALADLGGIERGKRFSDLLSASLSSWYQTYGVRGTLATLRNMTTIQRGMLAELAQLNLFQAWPRHQVPVHFIFGRNDPLVPPFLIDRLSRCITQSDVVTVVPESGHMVHFDEPEAVRGALLRMLARQV